MKNILRLICILISLCSPRALSMDPPVTPEENVRKLLLNIKEKTTEERFGMENSIRKKCEKKKWELEYYFLKEFSSDVERDSNLKGIIDLFVLKNNHALKEDSAISAYLKEQCQSELVANLEDFENKECRSKLVVNLEDFENKEFFKQQIKLDELPVCFLSRFIHEYFGKLKAIKAPAKSKLEISLNEDKSSGVSLSYKTPQKKEIGDMFKPGAMLREQRTEALHEAAASKVPEKTESKVFNEQTAFYEVLKFFLITAAEKILSNDDQKEGSNNSVKIQKTTKKKNCTIF